MSAWAPTDVPWPTSALYSTVPSSSPTPLPILAPGGGLNPGLSTTYGTESLSGGFQPDPHTVSIVSGGSVSVREALGSGCIGYVNAAPSLRLEWSGTASRLRIFFVPASSGDATMAIQDPDGRWFCNDDSPFGSLSPLIELTNPAAGTYNIWFGSYSSGVSIPGTAYFTSSDLHPNNLSGGAETPAGSLDHTLTPNFGSAVLGTGFVPDPFTVSLVSGGSVNVSGLGLGSGCGGYATRGPDFLVDWTGTTSRLRVFFVANESGEDTRLIVHDAAGTWVCNDDFASLNPMVEFSNPPSGQYEIWVASYHSGDFIGGTLYITTQDYNPGRLP